MLTSLQEVVERLVEEYGPDRIILFGSHVTGRAHPDSDFDLIIVKETDGRPLDRGVEVERLLADRDVPLDLHVYTPKELWELYLAGSPLIDEVMETGRVVYMRKSTAAWLRDAREELESARILYDNGKYRGACLHSQQCVEKGLKTLILERGERVPRTHDVLQLLNAATAKGWTLSLPMDDAAFLNQIYRGRYPTEEGLLPYGEPTQEDAQRALRAATEFLEELTKALD